MPSFDEYAEAKIKLRQIKKKFAKFKENRSLNKSIFLEHNETYPRVHQLDLAFDKNIKNCISEEKYTILLRKWQEETGLILKRRKALLDQMPFSWRHDVMEELNIYKKIEQQYLFQIDELEAVVEDYEDELEEDEKRKNSELEDLMAEIEELRRKAQEL